MTRRQLTLLLTALAGEHASAEQANNSPDNGPVLEGKIYDLDNLPWRKSGSSATQSKGIFNGFTTRGQRLTMHATALPPGQEPHAVSRQPHEEILILQQGRLECTINGQTATLKAGDVIYSAYNDLKGWKNIGADPAIYYVISLEEHR